MSLTNFLSFLKVRLTNHINFSFTLNTGILTNFRTTWKSLLLYKIIVNECEAIQQGQTSSSLLHRIHASIKFTLLPLVIQVITAICSNYALETIMNIHSGDENNKTLLKLVINTIYPPQILDIVTHNLNTITTVHCHYYSPSSFVLFDVISEKILSLLRISCSTNSNVLEILRPAFKLLVKRDPISSVVNFINSKPELLISFKRDLITRTLQLPSLKGKWLDLAVTFLDSFRTGNDILELYLLLHHRGSTLSSLGVMLHPMLYLNDPTTLIDALRADFSQLRFNPTDVDKIKANIINNSIKTLYENLIACTTSTNFIDNWLSVFHQFHTRNPHHNSLVGSLQPLSLLKLDIMTIMFFFLKAGDSYAIKQTYEWIVRAYKEEITSVLGFSHFVPLLESLYGLMQ